MCKVLKVLILYCLYRAFFIYEYTYQLMHLITHPTCFGVRYDAILSCYTL
jgi:hypothetical protein